MNKPLKGFNLFQIAQELKHQLMIRDEIATCSVHLGQNVPQSRNSTALVGDVDRILLIAKKQKIDLIGKPPLNCVMVGDYIQILSGSKNEH